MSWAERAVDRSPVVQRSRSRSLKQAQQIVAAARRLIDNKGADFTTQELVKEAGVALQTFYRHFASKDQLLLAVIEDLIAESCAAYEEQARDLQDPVARLHFYITGALQSLDGEQAAGPRFITSEHWRLHRLFPDELAEAAVKPFADLIQHELQAAQEAGVLAPRDPEHDAWFATHLVMAVYHHYAYATTKEPADVIAERLWAFCLSAFGGGDREAQSARRRTSKRRSP